jgi:hypothetical protein
MEEQTMNKATYEQILETKIFSGGGDFLKIKTSLINEAIDLPSGTQTARIKTVINKLGGNEGMFFKPGKEAARKTPNLYDMYPAVFANGVDITERWGFEKLWEYLIKISIVHKATFKKVLVLLYRLCFFIDYKQIDGEYRYIPSDELTELIANIQSLVLTDGFQDKFSTTEIELLDFINFVDLLAWNEDVKYNAPKGEPYFKNYSNSKTGRTNTILSIISAPILISNFIDDIICKSSSGGVIDVSLITSTIQRFTKSRGLCVLSNTELKKHLTPYLV